MTAPHLEPVTLKSPLPTVPAGPAFCPFENLTSERAQIEWARCRDWIKQASDQCSAETLESIEESISEGLCFFWAGPDCAAVTRFEDYPNGKRNLTVVYVGGNLTTAMREGLPALEAFARMADCTGVAVLTGENEKVGELKAMGFGISLVSLTKPISREVQ